MDITNQESVEHYVATHDFSAVIHCAALARMNECEKEPGKAWLTNTVGTGHCVRALLQKKVRFVHISTDGVYPGTKGNYSEDDETVPYNTYGWTKLAAETIVRLLEDHCIVRTRFFDPTNIPFTDAATDRFTSTLPIDQLVKVLHFLLKSDFRGIVNVGGKRVSDYDAYKPYKPSLEQCTYEDLLGYAGIALAKDASLNCGRWKALGGGT